MAISSFRSAASSAVSSFNDFTLSVTSTTDTTYLLDREYSSGRYSISLLNGDSTYDIYAISSSGLNVGYTNGSVIETSEPFDKVSVLGAALNEKVIFEYVGFINQPSFAGNILTAGAFISQVVTASLPNIGDTTLINGGNFATDVQVEFTGQNAISQSAKAITRISSTQLNVTRPDSFDVSNAPYTVTVSNPGITAPTGSNAHVLSNAVTSGTVPTWVTGNIIFYNLNGFTTSTVVEASDSESSVSYSLQSGSLPSGLSLSSGGTISGTFNVSASEGDSASITIRATDNGGNFVDKTFSLTANSEPTWTTASELPQARTGTSYSEQLQTSTGLAGGAVSYSVVAGSLPSGITLSGSGLLSGSTAEPENTTSSFTVRATDEAGAFADRAFTLLTAPSLAITGGTLSSDSTYYYHTFSGSDTLNVVGGPLPADVLVVAGGGGGGASGGAGGGGAGGLRTLLNQSIADGDHSVSVGSGGAGTGSGGGRGGTGGSSSFGSLGSSTGGGGGGGSYSFGFQNNSAIRSGTSGGSGGGGLGTTPTPGSGGAGISGQGNSGGQGGAGTTTAGGGGGGAGSAGPSGNTSSSSNQRGGNGVNVFGANYAWGGIAGRTSNTNSVLSNNGSGPGSGGAGGFNGSERGSSGGSAGRVVVRYERSLVD